MSSQFLTLIFILLKLALSPNAAASRPCPTKRDVMKTMPNTQAAIETDEVSLDRRKFLGQSVGALMGLSACSLPAFGADANAPAPGKRSGVVVVGMSQEPTAF